MSWLVFKCETTLPQFNNYFQSFFWKKKRVFLLKALKMLSKTTLVQAIILAPRQYSAKVIGTRSIKSIPIVWLITLMNDFLMRNDESRVFNKKQKFKLKIVIKCNCLRWRKYDTTFLVFKFRLSRMIHMILMTYSFSQKLRLITIRSI